MNHPDNEILLTYADGELSGEAQQSVATHVAVCDECRAFLAGIGELLGILTLAVHAVDETEPESWQRVVFRPSAGSAAVGSEPTLTGRGAGTLITTPSAQAGRPRGVATTAARARRRSTPAMTWRWAAGVVLFVAAAASATVLAFPELLRNDEAPAVRSLSTTPQAAPAAAAAAVLVRAVDGRVDIALTGVAAGTRLRVEFVAGSDAGVEVSGEGTPRFQARDGRIDADLGGAGGVVRVTVPRTLAAATVTANGIVAVQIAGERVTPPDALDGIVLGSGERPGMR